MIRDVTVRPLRVYGYERIDRLEGRKNLFKDGRRKSVGHERRKEGRGHEVDCHITTCEGRTISAGVGELANKKRPSVLSGDRRTHLTRRSPIQKPNPYLLTELNFVVPHHLHKLFIYYILYIPETYSAGPSPGTCRPPEAAKVKFIIRT